MWGKAVSSISDMRSRRHESIIDRRGYSNLSNALWHKVLTYIEYRAVSGVFRTIWPPPPLHPASVSSPTIAGRWRGGGSIYRKTPDIGLASHSIIPLREGDTFSGSYVDISGDLFSWFRNFYYLLYSRFFTVFKDQLHTSTRWNMRGSRLSEFE